MELAALFFYSFGVGFSGAMMPGPLLAVDIAETHRHGWKTGPVLSVGHAVAEIAVVLVLALGVAAVASEPIIARTIGVVGGLALVLMGGAMAHDTLRRKISYESSGEAKSAGFKLAGKGITATLSNPYWFVWWVTVGLALLVKGQEFGVFGAIVVYFGHILSDFVWYTIVSILLWKGRKLLMGTGLKVLLLICAAFLLYLGGSFIYDGWTGRI
jgi:threonine/homoserine/homoserine lactone efflux protein